MTPHLYSAMRWHIHTPNNHLLLERQLERWAEIFSAFPRQDVPRSSHLAVVPYNSLHWPLPYRWRCDPVSNSGSDSEPEWHIDVSVTQKNKFPYNFIILFLGRQKQLCRDQEAPSTAPEQRSSPRERQVTYFFPYYLFLYVLFQERETCSCNRRACSSTRPTGARIWSCRHQA